jgi:hypothetical protein
MRFSNITPKVYKLSEFYRDIAPAIRDEDWPELRETIVRMEKLEEKMLFSDGVIRESSLLESYARTASFQEPLRELFGFGNSAKDRFIKAQRELEKAKKQQAKAGKDAEYEAKIKELNDEKAKISKEEPITGKEIDPKRSKELDAERNESIGPLFDGNEELKDTQEIAKAIAKPPVIDPAKAKAGGQEAAAEIAKMTAAAEKESDPAKKKSWFQKAAAKVKDAASKYGPLALDTIKSSAGPALKGAGIGALVGLITAGPAGVLAGAVGGAVRGAAAAAAGSLPRNFCEAQIKYYTKKGDTENVQKWEKIKNDSKLLKVLGPLLGTLAGVGVGLGPGGGIVGAAQAAANGGFETLKAGLAQLGADAPAVSAAAATEVMARVEGGDQPNTEEIDAQDTDQETETAAPVIPQAAVGSQENPIENSVESVARAKVGDWIKNDNGELRQVTQGDINAARNNGGQMYDTDRKALDVKTPEVTDNEAAAELSAGREIPNVNQGTGLNAIGIPVRGPEVSDNGNSAEIPNNESQNSDNVSEVNEQSAASQETVAQNSVVDQPIPSTEPFTIKDDMIYKVGDKFISGADMRAREETYNFKYDPSKLSIEETKISPVSYDSYRSNINDPIVVKTLNDENEMLKAQAISQTSVPASESPSTEAPIEAKIDSDLTAAGINVQANDEAIDNAIDAAEAQVANGQPFTKEGLEQTATAAAQAEGASPQEAAVIGQEVAKTFEEDGWTPIGPNEQGQMQYFKDFSAEAGNGPGIVNNQTITDVNGDNRISRGDTTIIKKGFNTPSFKSVDVSRGAYRNDVPFKTMIPATQQRQSIDRTGIDWRTGLPFKRDHV